MVKCMNRKTFNVKRIKSLKSFLLLTSYFLLPAAHCSKVAYFRAFSMVPLPTCFSGLQMLK